MLISLTGSLIYNGALWPSAIVIVAVIGFKAFKEHLASVKVSEVDTTLSDKLKSLESKVAMMGLKR
jgi:hypothetical protein